MTTLTLAYGLPLAFGLPGTTEWIIILIIALLIFGSRLPKVMRSMGQSVNEFKRGMRDINDEFDQPEKLTPPREPDNTVPRSNEAEKNRETEHVE